ncbi:MAG: peptide chain release factor N(5)-glutamine methyltransferase [Alphaproteobacteria bacterium]|nr:peptide chain release factor N(5)-glutamine methyltransferase [Alphaproteobacteria bacterium]
MNLNQAFEILKQAGGAQAARIVLQNKKKINRLQAFLIARKLRRGVPVAKITGEKWFYGLPFRTTRHTLDPRPDSETLVEAVLQGGHKTPTILDLGTGTGCLICAVVKNLPGSAGVGIDKSWRALRVARKNVKDLGLQDKIEIIKKDFTSYLLPPTSYLFDIIISNPPYIAAGDKRVNAGARHDPELALYAGADGLDAYRAIASSARKMLKPRGKIFLEIGVGQSDAVCEIFASAGWRHLKSYKDLGGIRRVLEFVYTEK